MTKHALNDPNTLILNIHNIDFMTFGHFRYTNFLYLIELD